jgi:DinB family protein
VIAPDTKDWTWVLHRPCPDCRFDASTCAPSAVPAFIRANAAAWRDLESRGAISAGRPDSSTWSALEYACHVRDVYRRYHDRIALMLTQHDPLFPNWDQDASAVEDAYEAQDPRATIDELTAAAEQVAIQLEQVVGSDWDRPGRRSDGASFTVGTIARYMVHDPIHHLWDVSRPRAGGR